MGGIFLELISLNAKFSGRFCEIMANLHTGGSWITKVKERLAFIILGEKNEDKLKNKLTKSRGNTIHQFYMVTASFCPRIRFDWLCFPSMKGICLFERTTGGTFDRCVSNYVKFFVKSHLCHLSIIITCRKTPLTALHNALVFAVLKDS